MNRLSYAGCLLAIYAAASWACVSPGNLQGVAFTDGETLDFDALASMGEENVNYFLDGTEPHIGFRFRSHYDPRAMVYVGNYGLSYMSDVYLNCMGVVLPEAELPDSLDPLYSGITVAMFDFNAAVLAEVEWLVDNGILGLSSDGLQELRRVFTEPDTSMHVSNGGMQYWTLQNTFLGYNSWYDYDDQGGVWGVDGPNAVRGVYSDGCSVVSVETALPSSELGSASVHGSHGMPAGARPGMQLIRDNRGTTVFLNDSHTGGVLSLLDARGVVVQSMQVAPGARSVTVPSMGRVSGWRMVSFRSQTRTVSQSGVGVR